MSSFPHHIIRSRCRFTAYEQFRVYIGFAQDRCGICSLCNICIGRPDILHLSWHHICAAFVLFNYGVMQGHGLIHSFKKSWRITEGKVLKMIGLSVSVSFLAPLLSLPFETPARLLDSLGYSILSVIIGIPAVVISSMATIAVLGAAYGSLITEQS